MEKQPLSDNNEGLPPSHVANSIERKKMKPVSFCVRVCITGAAAEMRQHLLRYYTRHIIKTSSFFVL
jgi:hypothetical protein